MSSRTQFPAPDRSRLDPESVSVALRRWLFSGRCQSASGAYCAWRDAETGQLAFEYPEINGYLLTFAAGLPDLEPVEAAAARRAADWLLRRLAVGDLSARTGWDGGAVYTFDLAMIATGLLSFGRRFGGEYVERGIELVDFLEDEIRAGGRLPAVARGPAAAHTGWAVQGRAHLLKVVQCFLLVDELSDSTLVGLAQQLIEESIALQGPDGRFVTRPDDELTMLHPHLYALEGLWIWGTACSTPWALERARAGVEWVLKTQLASGGFPRFVRVAGGELGPEQADATAQAVRLARLVGAPEPALARALAWLGKATTGEEDARAVVYQPSSGARHENVWATLFTAQALGLAATTEQGYGWEELV